MNVIPLGSLFFIFYFVMGILGFVIFCLMGGPMLPYLNLQNLIDFVQENTFFGVKWMQSGIWICCLLFGLLVRYVQ